MQNKYRMHFFILIYLILFTSCGKSEIDLRPVSNPDKVEDIVDVPEPPAMGIDTSVLSPIERSFIPATSPAIYDSQYMNKLSDYLEEVSSKYENSRFFFDVVKTIAWKESRWTHYYLEDNFVFLITGDSGASIGIFQIYTKYHPYLPEVIANSEYAINLISRIVEKARTTECEKGSNRGNSQSAVLRRIYAAYNGGGSNICRNNHFRDDSFVNFYQDKPWKDYL